METFPQKQVSSFDIGNVQDLLIGVKWDMFDRSNTVDLDASCVFFDIYGRLVNAVYYNQLNIDCAHHSGDNRTGEGEGYDEVIHVKMSMIQPIIGSMMVCITCHSGGNFLNVETAEAAIVNPLTNKTLTKVSIGCKGNHTALVHCCIFRDFNLSSDGNFWKLREINRVCNGKHFKHIEKEMKEELTFLVPLEIQNEMRFDMSFPSKTFEMSKGDTIRLEGVKKVKMGVGWDTRCDIDASVVEIKHDKTSFGDTVYYGKLQNGNRSIRHSGDNLTGIGSGDDESITIELNKIDPRTCYLVLVVNVFSGGKSFSDVQGAYCRLYIMKTRHTICKYDLGSRQFGGEGMVMAILYRSKMEGIWKMKAVGEMVKGRTAEQSKRQFFRLLPNSDYSHGCWKGKSGYFDDDFGGSSNNNNSKKERRTAGRRKKNSGGFICCGGDE